MTPALQRLAISSHQESRQILGNWRPIKRKLGMGDHVQVYERGLDQAGNQADQLVAYLAQRMVLRVKYTIGPDPNGSAQEHASSPTIEVCRFAGKVPLISGRGKQSTGAQDFVPLFARRPTALPPRRFRPAPATPRSW